MQLEQKIEDIEIKLAFQESTIEALNRQLIKLNALVDAQQDKLDLLLSRVQTIAPDDIVNQADEKPPHY